MAVSGGVAAAGSAANAQHDLQMGEDDLSPGGRNGAADEGLAHRIAKRAKRDAATPQRESSATTPTQVSSAGPSVKFKMGVAVLRASARAQLQPHAPRIGAPCCGRPSCRRAFLRVCPFCWPFLLQPQDQEVPSKRPFALLLHSLTCQPAVPT